MTLRPEPDGRAAALDLNAENVKKELLAKYPTKIGRASCRERV